EAAVDALFRQAGVLRARTLEELVDVAALLSSQPLPRGRRVAVLTNAAGLELPELADETRAALAEHLPAEASVANPVDLLGSATAATYTAALPPLLGDPHVDALIALFVPPVVAGAEEVAAAIAETVERATADKPVLVVVISAEGMPSALRDEASPVAAFLYPESAARALGLAAERAEWLRRPVGAVPTLEDVAPAA